MAQMAHQTIKEQSKEIFNYLYEMGKSKTPTPSHDNSVQLVSACIDATAKIMQAKIIATVIAAKIF